METGKWYIDADNASYRVTGARLLADADFGDNVSDTELELEIFPSSTIGSMTMFSGGNLAGHLRIVWAHYNDNILYVKAGNAVENSTYIFSVPALEHNYCVLHPNEEL